MKNSLAALLATGILSAFVAAASAQTAPAQPPRGGGAGAGPGGGVRGAFVNRGSMLDDQQRQLYREALQKDTDKIRALDEKLRAAQKELVDATLATNYDEKVVREKAEAVAKIQVELTMLRAKALAAVAPTLKPEQKQDLSQSRFAIIMLSGGPGGFDMIGGFGGRADRGGDRGAFGGRNDRGGDRGGRTR